jgi:hypothetical protein
MPTAQAVEEWLIQGIDEIRAANPSLEWAPPDAHTILIGAGALLDSLDFSTLMANIEGRIADVTGRDYVLDVGADAAAGGSKGVTVTDLAALIVKLVENGRAL